MPTERIPPREFFLRIAEQYAASNTTQSTSFATNWFRRKVVELRNTNDLPDADTMTNMGANLRSQYNVSRVVNRVVPGHMYLYEYGAESYPMRIDYYDRFPLVIVLEPYKGGFLGLNLHYLNIKRRLELFVQLSTLLNNENYNFRSKFSRISYDRLKPFTKYRNAKPCIKRYKYNNVESRLLKVFGPEWEIALFLPLQQFKGRSESTAYTDSRRNLANQ